MLCGTIYGDPPPPPRDAVYGDALRIEYVRHSRGYHATSQTC